MKAGPAGGHTRGFAPLAGDNAHSLILGSLPSVQSVEVRQYYGNPRNAFWNIMSELYGTSDELDYARRVELLTQRGIAVWDVLASSVRPGSLDADIDERTAVVNEFATFFASQPRLRRVFFNGKAAARIYRRRVLPDLTENFSYLDYETLPSTSPAYAAMSFTAKLEHWSVLRGNYDVP